MRKDEVLAERFRIDRLGGSGAFGKVYRAIDTTDGSAVAVKVLQGAGDDRFAREARILASIEHPGIVRYVTHGETPEGEPFLVTEWLDGETLSARLQADRLSVAEAIELGYRIASALEAAHQLGVVHRDLKPANLFLVGGRIEAAKVLDFGVARLLDRGQALTATGVMVGTIGYMAPEQARGQRDVDARADVFALGCVIFRCVMGRPPFSGEDMLAVLLKVIADDVPPMRAQRPEVPEALDALVAAMLAKDPAARPANGAAVAAELDAMRAERLDAGPAPSARWSLTGLEQRVMSLVLAGARSEVSVDETVAEAFEDNRERAVQVVAARHGGQLGLLADGTVLITFSSGGTASDLATRAARCALSLRPLLGSTPIVAASGLGLMSARLPLGETIDRAVRRMARTPRDTVWIDDATLALLGPSFVTVPAKGGAELKMEGEADQARTLLGRPTSCVGRERELGLLETTFAQCTEDRVARAVLITGEPGSGKSRVRYEFVRRLRQIGDDVEIWIARGSPMSQASAFSMLAQVLRRAAGIGDGEPLAVRREKLLARVSQRLPPAQAARVDDLLGELIGAPTPDAHASPELAAARSDPAAMGERIRKAWVDFVDAECAARPVALVLEDLHWGDLPTIHFVEAALRSAACGPFFVLALARPDVRSTFPRLLQWPDLQEVKLPKLTRRAGERLVRQVLGGVPVALIEEILDHADGNAFYLEELIRSAAEHRGEAVPASVVSMAQSRLEALPSEARRLLRAASVFGTVFWRGAVAALLRDERCDALLETLTQREVIAPVPEPRFPGQAEYRFRHALLRDAAYAMLTDADRVKAHRAAGAWLAARGEGDAAVLARHFEQGGAQAEAARHYKRAAADALRGNDLDAAIERAQRGIACGATGDAHAELCAVLLEAHGWRNEWVATAEHADAVFCHAPPGSRDWSMAAVGKVLTAPILGRMNGLMAAMTALRWAEPSPDAMPEFVQAMNATVTTLTLGGSHAAAASYLARMEALAGPLERAHPAVAGWVHLAQGFRVRQLEGDAYRSLRHHRLGEASFVRAGTPQHVLWARTHIAVDLLLLGDHEGAEQSLAPVLQSSSGASMTLVSSYGRQVHANLLADRGELEAARDEAAALAVQERRLGNRFFEAVGRITLASVLWRLGDLSAASTEAEAAIDLLPLNPFDRALAQIISAGIRLDQGRPAEALRFSKEAHRQILRAPGHAEMLARRVHALALAATGDRTAAVTEIMYARRLLLDRAAAIEEPELRRSFLERSPTNADAMALAAKWLG